MLSVRVLRGLLAAAESSGVSRQALNDAANHCGLDLEMPDERVSRSQAYRFLGLVMEAAGDSALGLHMGTKMTGYALNPLADLIAHAPTLRDALTALTQFHGVLSDHRSVQLSERGGQVTLRCQPFTDESERVRRFTTEMLVVSLYRLVSEFSGDPSAIERVSFDYPAPPYRDEYARAFAGAERFEQPFTGLVFAQALMDAPSPHADRGLHGALRTIAEQQIERAGHRSTALRVREFLVRQGPGLRLSMDRVARGIGLSERSLRRRLAEEGTSYTAVANEALARIALGLLVDGQRTIQETAVEMGFSNARAFHRAFKAWTGTTPRAYREALLKLPAADD